MKFLLVGVNSKFIHTNLALFYLEAYAKKYLDEKVADSVQIKEFTINQPIEKIIQEIYLEKPDIIGFSCYIWNIEYIKKIVNMYNKIDKDIPIWLGGPEVSYHSQNILKDIKSVKGIMVGEGEETFNELLSAYYSCCSEEKEDFENKDYDNKICNVSKSRTYDINLGEIKGLVFRNENGEIILNPQREYIDFSKVPFPYSDLKRFENRILYYETTRGCPFNCKYCLSSVDKKVRIRNMDLVKEELKFFIDNKVNQVKFVDRTFNCHKNHALDILNYIKENDNGITNFHFEVAADLMDDELIEVIEGMRCGLVQFEIGVQTTNEITIGEIARKTDINKIYSVVNKINKFNNTHLHLDLIAGLPFENYEDFKKSFNDVYDMHPSQLQLGFLKILKGSAMEDEAKKYGIIYSDSAPYEVLKTKWLSYEDISKLKDIEEVLEIYYNSGQFINSLQVVNRYFENPFKMFEALADYYRKEGFFGLTPNRETKYIRLFKFFENVIERKNESACNGNVQDYINAFSEVLTIDYYMREKSKKHPAFAKGKYEWNKDKTVHIEFLKYNPIAFIKRNEIEQINGKVETIYLTKNFLGNFAWKYI